MPTPDTSYVTLEEIASLCKRRGFIYPTSEIYGGLANTYDFGPLGAQLLKNIKDLWWKRFIEQRQDMVGLDSQIFQHPETWVASGHVASFNDPLVEDTITHKRYRADHLVEVERNNVLSHKFSLEVINSNTREKRLLLFESYLNNSVDLKDYISKIEGQMTAATSAYEQLYLILLKDNQNIPIVKFLRETIVRHYNNEQTDNFSDTYFNRYKESQKKLTNKDLIVTVKYWFFWATGSVEALSLSQITQVIDNFKIISPDGNPLSMPKAFNLLFETAIGSVADEKSQIYLRGETAQGIFANFKQVLNSTRVQLPFGIGQIGKSFRNEVTTGQFIFRTLELEQAEIEYFFNPTQTKWQDLLEQWKSAMWQFVTKDLGVSEANLQWRQHTDTERSFYSKDTYDLDYRFSFGFKELWGVAYRTDYDLKQHQQHSGEDLTYRDPHTGETFLPHVIEPALGIGRAVLMVLTESYWNDVENHRLVLRLPTHLAPIQVAVFPLLKNKPELVEFAQNVFKQLSPHVRTTWDDRGNIGKRYLYQDEIGTPLCVTVDFDSLSDQTVTVRHRDTTEQVRVHLDELLVYCQKETSLPL